MKASLGGVVGFVRVEGLNKEEEKKRKIQEFNIHAGRGRPLFPILTFVLAPCC
jgi:hypothetical protein